MVSATHPYYSGCNSNPSLYVVVFSMLHVVFFMTCIACCVWYIVCSMWCTACCVLCGAYSVFQVVCGMLFMFSDTWCVLQNHLGVTQKPRQNSDSNNGAVEPHVFGQCVSWVYAQMYELRVVSSNLGSTMLWRFFAISPLVKMLVRPNGSIVIAIVIGTVGAGGDPPPPLYPPLPSVTQFLTQTTTNNLAGYASEVGFPLKLDTIFEVGGGGGGGQKFGPSGI